MFHVVCGLPGRFTDWCAAVAVTALRGRGRTVQTVGIGTVTDLARSALAASADDVVAIVHAAAEPMIGMIAERPCVVALGDPATLPSLLDPQGTAGTLAVFQRASIHAATTASLARSAAATTVALDAALGDPEAAAARIATAFGIAPPDAAAHWPILEQARAERDAARGAGRADARAQAVRVALQNYLDAQSIALAPALFRNPAAPSDPLGPVDVTGLARVLVAGPFAALPAGGWEARIAIELSPAASEGVYRVQAVAVSPGGERELAFAVLRPGMPGAAGIALSFTAPSPNTPVDFRIGVEKAMFDGTLTLNGVHIHRR